MTLPENCPICRKKMEKGYVTAAGPTIFWNEKPKEWTTWGAEILVSSRAKITQVNTEVADVQTAS